MPKLPNLLSLHPALAISVVFILSCSTQPQIESRAENHYVSQGPVEESAEVKVDKENNSIKIVPEQIKASKKLKKRFSFDWPVWEARMTRGFLPRGTKRRRRPHKGIDLAAPRGTAVLSSHDGEVIYTGKGFKGYGKMVMIESPDGWATLYGHLDKIIVPEGHKIRQGEVIGALGNTGRSSGPHLHFEIRKLDGPVDPLPLLPAGEALTNDVDNGSVDE